MARLSRTRTLLAAMAVLGGLVLGPSVAQAHTVAAPTASWHASTAKITPVGEVIAVSCATSSQCEAVTLAGQAAALPSSTPDATTIDPAGNTPDGISCPTTTFCVAVDAAGNLITERNGSWGAPVPAVQQKPSPILWDSVSCSSATQCLAVGLNSQFFPEYAYLQGTTWHVGETTETQTEFTSVSCQGNTCLAVNSNGESVTFTFANDGVPTFGAPKGIDSSQQGYVSYSISCATPTYCVAGGKDGILVPWSNGVWGAGVQVFPAASTNGTEVSCATLGCVAVNQLGSYAAQVTPGGSWSMPTLAPTTDVRPEGLACNDTTGQTPTLACTGIDLFGFTYAISLDQSNVPVVTSTPTMFAPATALRTITCLHPTTCLIGSTGGKVATWNGTSLPLSPQVTNDDFGAKALSCTAHTSTAATSCALLTSGGDVYIQTGLAGDWVLQPADAGAIALNCTAGCEALLPSGETVGVTQGTIPNFPSGTPAELRCFVTTGNCVALTNTGQAWLESSGQWSTISSVPLSAGATVTAFDCVSVLYCVAGTSTGRLDTLSGLTWHQSAVVTDQRVHTISCAATYFCMATDTAGNAWVFNGVTWKRSFAPSIASQVLLGVSCPTTSSCAATTIFGVEQFTLSQFSSSMKLSVGTKPTTARTVVSALLVSKGAPSGTVTFTLGAATCTGNLHTTAKGVVATCTITHALKGGQTLSATYAGNYGYAPARGSSHVSVA